MVLCVKRHVKPHDIAALLSAIEDQCIANFYQILKCLVRVASEDHINPLNLLGNYLVLLDSNMCQCDDYIAP